MIANRRRIYPGKRTKTSCIKLQTTLTYLAYKRRMKQKNLMCNQESFHNGDENVTKQAFFDILVSRAIVSAHGTLQTTSTGIAE